MRANIVMLAVLAGVGISLSAEAVAESKNLSCITDLPPSERRLLRDCGTLETPIPDPVVQEMPIIPPPPIPVKHGEGGKGGGVQRDKDHESPAGGGNAGGPNSAAN